MNERIARLLEAAGHVPIVITKPENVLWLSGFTGEGALVIAPDGNTVITDFRYEESAAVQAAGFEVCVTAVGRGLNSIIKEKLAGRAAKAELDKWTVSGFEKLKEETGCAFEALDGAVEKLRVIKDADEIAKCRAACAITDKAFDYILGFIKPGMTEREVAAELYSSQIRLGAEELSFKSIVASGPNASLPHAEPSLRKIGKGDVLTMDFGCIVDGYHSDFTRTIAIGSISDELRRVYQIVLDAQLRALDTLAPGKTGQEVDAAARDYIDSMGYEGRFGHGLGHGVGLMIHEEPRLSVKGDNVLVPGHIVTVEPGIYLPGVGGVRIEDMCALTVGGHENFTKSPKQLIVL